MVTLTEQEPITIRLWPPKGKNMLQVARRILGHLIDRKFAGFPHHSLKLTSMVWDRESEYSICTLEEAKMHLLFNDNEGRCFRARFRMYRTFNPKRYRTEVIA